MLVVGAAAAAALMNLSLQPPGSLKTDTDASPAVDAPSAAGSGSAAANAPGATPGAAGPETDTGTLVSAGGDEPMSANSLDRSWVAVLPIPEDAASGALLAVANERREMLMRRIEATEGLRLVEPALVQSYFDGGMSDLEIGRTTGAGVVIVAEIETRQSVSRISFSKLDASNEFVLAGTQYTYREDLADLAAADAERFTQANEFLWDNGLSVLIDVMLREAYPGLAPSADEMISRTQAVLLDVGRSESERVDALQALSGMRRPDPLVIDAAISLLQNSADPEVRGRAIRSMERVDDPALVQPLLQALAYDASADVRAEAAEALGAFADDPAVLDALARAEAGDDAGEVRAAAAWAGLSDGERLARRREAFLDPNLPTIERVHELNFGISSSALDPPLPIDDAIARELVDMSLNDPDPNVRGLAMTELYYAGEKFPAFRLDPSLSDSLIATLRENADPRLRITAVYALRLMPGTPNVRAALEAARDNDPDRLVRNGARDALERVQ